MTKLAVIDCASMNIKGFDGKLLVNSAVIEIDKETTRASLLDVINDFRMESDVEEMKKQKAINARKARAKYVVSSWFKLLGNE